MMKKRKINKLRGLFGFIVVMMFVATTITMMSLHNIDNAWNMRYIENQFDTKLKDCSAINNCFNAQGLYNLGIVGVVGGSCVYILGVVFLIWFGDQK